MAKFFSSKAVISGDNNALPEVFFEGSEDELGIEDEKSDNSESEFEPLRSLTKVNYCKIKARISVEMCSARVILCHLQPV